MTAQLASTDREAWLRLLARWGLITAVTVAGLIAVFFSGLAAVSTQPGAGGNYDELLMAAFAPTLYRIAMVLDAVGWLAMGGLIVIAGLALRPEVSVRGLLAAALGVSAITGVIGAFLRLMVVGDLGRQFAGAAALDREGILSLYRSVEWIVGAHFAAGQLTNGLGFLVIGSAALAVSWVPRPVGWLMVLPGVTSLALLVGQVAFDVFLFPVLLLHVVLLAILGLAVARSWWRVPVQHAVVMPQPPQT